MERRGWSCCNVNKLFYSVVLHTLLYAPHIFLFCSVFLWKVLHKQTWFFFSFFCLENPLKISPTRTALADSPHCCGVPEFINSNWSLLKHPARACGSLLLYSTSAALFLGVVRWLLWWKVFDTYSCFYVKWQGCAWHVCLQNKQQKGPVKRTKPLELQQFDRCFYQSTSICNQFFLTARAKVLFFFLQLLNVEFMEYLDNCSCTVQFAQKTTDVWLITHLGMLNKEVRVNRWIYKCVCVCVCLPMCFSQGASECFICHHKDRDKGCRSQDTQRCSQLCVLGFRDVVTKYNISPVWKMLEEIFTSVNQIRILRCDWIFLQWHHFVLKNSWDCVPHKSLQSNFSI